jgi:cytochrome c oxidase subunit I+III
MNTLPADATSRKWFEESQARELEKAWGSHGGLRGWLVSTNHKDIGRRYIITAFVFFLMAGVLALAMRIQLSGPENHFLTADQYNQFFSVHGTAMMFLFAVPIMEGLGLYFVPLVIGTRNVAFPRLNAFGYFVFLFGGLMLFVSLALNIGPDAGWFSYVPLSGPQFSPGKRIDIWSQMVTLTEISALVGAVEIITTVFKQRAPGMSLSRIPLLIWAQVITSFMIIFAMPAVMVATGCLAMDRLAHVNTHFFNPAEGGDTLLYQHMFWFFGHPEVYIIFIPATGFVSTIVENFSHRKIFGYYAMVLSLVATAFIGFGLWVHHMFATPMPQVSRAFFTAASMLIAIPTGIQIFCWIATLWDGKPVLKTPLLWVLGFIAVFVIGGMTGVMLASMRIDSQVHDTFFVVAHFHYVLIGGAVFPLFGALHYWFPKWTGRLLNETLGKWYFGLFFIGFNLTFFPMHVLGLHGMTRRIYTYVPGTGWSDLNLLATTGAFVMGLAVLLFLLNCLLSRKRGAFAGPDPWHASTLEWTTSSPPPNYNYLHLPTVQGRVPNWENPAEAPVVVGLSVTERELLTTTIVDAVPEHRYEISPDSIWPLILALVVGADIVALIFHPIAFPIGLGAALVVLAFWFWRGNEPGWLVEGVGKENTQGQAQQMSLKKQHAT